MQFYTKHDAEALVYAKQVLKIDSSVPNGDCILIDDSQTNIRVAKENGWTTVLVGYVGRDQKSQRDFTYADFVIERLSDLDQVMPDLFKPKN